MYLIAESYFADKDFTHKILNVRLTLNIRNIWSSYKIIMMYCQLPYENSRCEIHIVTGPVFFFIFYPALFTSVFPCLRSSSSLLLLAHCGIFGPQVTVDWWNSVKLSAGRSISSPAFACMCVLLHVDEINKTETHSWLHSAT